MAKKKVVLAIASKVREWKKELIAACDIEALDENSSWEDILKHDSFDQTKIKCLITKLPAFDANEVKYLGHLPYYNAMKTAIVEEYCSGIFDFLKPSEPCIVERCNKDIGFCYCNGNVVKAFIVNPLIAKEFNTDLLYVYLGRSPIYASINFVKEFPQTELV